MSHAFPIPPDDRRTHQRRSVPAMYSSVEVKAIGATPTGNESGIDSDAGAAAVANDDLISTIVGPAVSGHVYDVSLGGARLELDGGLADGLQIDVQMHLPAEREAVHVSAVVVRVFDVEDDPGARRVAVRFEAFDAPADEARLRRYLGEAPLRVAA
ncbi:MAG: PilZ domain-containing protein [Phycisphaerales bacterium]